MRLLIPIVAMLLVVPALVGCIGTDDPSPENEEIDAASVPPERPPLPDGFAYTCPPGETTERESTGLCVQRIATRTTSLQEPFLAIDPYREGVMAIGTNAGHTTGALDPDRETPGATTIRMDIYVTEDGGESWTRTTLPYIPEDDSGPVDVGGVGDPALVFAPDGTLHVSGIATQKVGVTGYEIFYTSTPDLGETWTDPVVITSDDDNDRQWMDRGPEGTLYIPWQNIGDSSELAWSGDDGETWRTLEAGEQAEDCITVSPMAFHEGTPYFACAGTGDNGYSGIEVHRFDPTTGNLTEVETLDAIEGVWPRLMTLADGGMLTMAEADDTVLASRTEEGPTGWGDPVDLREGASVDDAWANMQILWWAEDPWGALHLVVAGPPSDPPGMFTWAAHGEMAIAHLVLDPADLTVIQERIISHRPSEENPRTDQPLAPPYGDHYYGLDFTEDEGLIVFTEDRGLEITRIEPTWATNTTSPASDPG